MWLRCKGPFAEKPKSQRNKKELLGAGWAVGPLKAAEAISQAYHSAHNCPPNDQPSPEPIYFEPPMDQTLSPDEERLLELLAEHDSLGPVAAATSLGLEKEKIVDLKDGLKAKGLIATGKGGSMQLAEPSGPEDNGTLFNEPMPVTYPMPGRKAKAPKEPKAKKAKKTPKPEPNKSLETWIWDAACSIRGAKDAPKYKDYILPLIFTKRLCDVFDDELDRIAAEVGSREKAFRLVKADKKLVRFYLPLVPADPNEPVWSVVRKLSDKIGEQLTTHLRDVAKANPLLQGIIDRVDFNATTHGQRDLADDRLSNLIEAISTKRLGLKDVEADIIGKSYEYLIRKFAEGGGQSAGEFYTPGEVGEIMARVLECEPGMEIYDPCCGSGGLLVKCESALDDRMRAQGNTQYAPLQLFGQEYVAETWAMANMNMIIHDMQGQIEIGDTFKNPKFRERGRLKTFDRVVANPMWNQDWFTEADYANDELDRFPNGAGFPGKASADWGWAQHIHASLKPIGRAAVVLDTGAASRGSGNDGNSKEREVRKYFVDNDLVESVLYLPDNLFYNTSAPGLVFFLRKAKPKARQGKVLLVNAGQLFEKGKPKNFLAPEHVDHIASVILAWKEEEKLSRILPLAELSDFNLSPSRYIHIGDANTYRPIAEILHELEVIEAEARVADASVKKIINSLGL
jgi:type I restriction enzyme M protein